MSVLPSNYTIYNRPAILFISMITPLPVMSVNAHKMGQPVWSPRYASLHFSLAELWIILVLAAVVLAIDLTHTILAACICPNSARAVGARLNIELR